MYMNTSLILMERYIISSLSREEKLMDTIRMSNKDLAEYLGIEYYCPENTGNIRLSFDYVRKQIEIDWPFVFLGVGSGYFDVGCLEKFACELEDGQAFSMSSTFHPKRCYSRNFLERMKGISSHIDLKLWCLSFEKLFYIAAKWLIDNVDFRDERYRYSLQVLWDDFYFINVAHDNIFFPGEFDDKWLLENAQAFLVEERSKIERQYCYESVRREECKSILKGWKMRYYEGEIPQLVKDYEESHKKL